MSIKRSFCGTLGIDETIQIVYVLKKVTPGDHSIPGVTNSLFQNRSGFLERVLFYHFTFLHSLLRGKIMNDFPSLHREDHREKGHRLL
jgi:hypothetical protein